MTTISPLITDLALQLALLGLVGATALTLAVRDFARRRDAGSLLLAAWVGGVFAFAAFTNWTATARAVLPAAPALGILAVRALPAERARLRCAIPLVLGAVVSLVVAAGDYALAETTRRAAYELAERFSGRGTLWFQGAWGFQWYLEDAGARKLVYDGTVARSGELVLAAEGNTNLFPFPGNSAQVIELVEKPVPAFASTLSIRRWAGFYASLYGPLPFSLGAPPAERYRVIELVADVQMRE